MKTKMGKTNKQTEKKKKEEELNSREKKKSSIRIKEKSA